MKRLILSLLSLTTTCLAVPVSRDTHVIHEERINRVSETHRRTRVDKDAIIPLRFALKQQNLENGYADLMEVSDPSSPKYGKHWTEEQVVRNPDLEVVQSYNKGWLAVNLPAWQAEVLLRTEYYEYYNPSDETVRLGCERYYLPSSVSVEVDFIRPGVSLSPPLKKHALPRKFSAVQGAPKPMPVRDNLVDTRKVRKSLDETTPTNVYLTNFLSTNGTSLNATRTCNTTLTTSTAVVAAGVTPAGVAPALQNCGSSITPACLRAMYHLPVHHTPGLADGLGVFEAGGAYDQVDLDHYFSTFVHRVPNGTHPTLASINGGQAPVALADGQGESVIDLDIMYAITYPEPITLYQVENPGIRATQQQFDDEVTFLNPFLDAIDGAFCTPLDTASNLDCGTQNLTKVVTVSYVALELEYGFNAQHRFCHEIMKLNLRGHTLVFASGDFGVAGFPKPTSNYNGCVSGSLSANGPTSGPIFNPGFPSNCPYVLSVGATKLTPGDTVHSNESVMAFPASNPSANFFGSGGGFSNYFQRPAYQDAAVSNYLTNHTPPYPSYSYSHSSSSSSAIGAGGGVFNAAGRAYPDVSANGASMVTFVGGKTGKWLGTSLAAPIWASVIALLNSERALIGKGTVGFVQPVLYRHPEVFHDIVDGSNLGCGTAGFAAAEGWDPATGLGTPRYHRLKELFLSLP